jgi:hypothetical protein
MKSLKMTDNPMTHWKLTGSEPMRAIWVAQNKKHILLPALTWTVNHTKQLPCGIALIETGGTKWHP